MILLHAVACRKGRQSGKQSCPALSHCRYVVTGSLAGVLGLWPVQALYSQAALGLSSACSLESAYSDATQEPCEPPHPTPLHPILSHQHHVKHNLTYRLMG